MHKGTVLSIDDDEGLQIVLRQYLENEGYVFHSANNGKETIEQLGAVQSDVILLDLVLPDTDGISLISQIRAQTQAPIVVVSGKSDTTEKIVCLEMGADDYMTKPFEMRELSARIKAALRRVTPAAVNDEKPEDHEREDEEKVMFAGYILNRNQFQLFDADGKSMELTTGEFELLEALVSKPHRALSREQLFEKTRDGEYDTYDRAIDIQIGRIRKKIGDDGADIIKTIRGVGYMFCPPQDT